MLISTAKITTWISPLKNWPLYIAPTPGMMPRTAAAIGFGAPDGGGATNGCWKFCQAAEHGSHRTWPPGALRAHFEHMALPQFWQYAVAAVPGWFTQSILCSFHLRLLRSRGPRGRVHVLGVGSRRSARLFQAGDCKQPPG